MTDHPTPIKPTSNLVAVRRPTCPECGALFETRTRDKAFCTDGHKATFHNRSSKVGRVLVPLAMAWREGRNVKGNSPEAKARRASAARAFSEMCRLLDAQSADDRANARAPKLAYVRRRWAVDGDLTPVETAAFHEKAATPKARKAKADAPATA